MNDIQKRLNAINNDTSPDRNKKIKLNKEIKFNKEILNRNFYIHCDTIEKAEALLSWAHKHNKHWASGISFELLFYHEFEERSCYNLFKGYLWPIDRLNCKDVLEFEEILV